ncbi:hypothetical protein EMCRGX_G017447 [Ephydatia muelleri]
MSRVAEARVGLNVDKLLPVGNVDFLDLFKSCGDVNVTSHVIPPSLSNNNLQDDSIESLRQIIAQCPLEELYKDGLSISGAIDKTASMFLDDGDTPPYATFEPNFVAGWAHMKKNMHPELTTKVKV